MVDFFFMVFTFCFCEYRVFIIGLCGDRLNEVDNSKFCSVIEMVGFKGLGIFCFLFCNFEVFIILFRKKFD